MTLKIEAMLNKFKPFHDPSEQQQEVIWYSYPIMLFLGVISYGIMLIDRVKW